MKKEEKEKKLETRANVFYLHLQTHQVPGEK
jgi:hypothetical protein